MKVCSVGDIDCMEQLSHLFWQDQRHRLSDFVDEQGYSSEGPGLCGTCHPILNLARPHGGVGAENGVEDVSQMKLGVEG